MKRKQKTGSIAQRFPATRLRKAALSIVSAVLFATAVQAQVANPYVVTATKDNSIYGALRKNTTSNGKGDYLIAGMVRTPGYIRRALVQFDLSKCFLNIDTVTPIILDSVKLSMWTSAEAHHDRGGGRFFYIYECPETWGEGCSDGSGHTGVGAPAESGDATWNSRYIKSQADSAVTASNIPWTYPGAINPADSLNYLADAQIPYDSISPPPANIVWSSRNLMALVQKWISNPCTNKGLVIVGPEVGAPDTLTAVSFYSKDACAVDSLKPRLIIYYHTSTSAALQQTTIEDDALLSAIIRREELLATFRTNKKND